MGKILYALQYHRGDQEAAMSLARLVADVIPEKKCSAADLMFVASHNADYDHKTVQYCARKFAQVRTFRCVKKVDGWPLGPNNMAFELGRYFSQQCMTGRWNYTGILYGEADCVPLRRDFLTLLRDEWEKGPPTILGPWVTSGPAPYNQHINGNSIFGPSFVYNNLHMFRAEDWIGWDAQNANFIMSHGRASLWIYSDYQLGTEQNHWKGCDHLFSPREMRQPHPFWQMRTQEVAYLHGAKRWDLAQACVRERLLGETIDESQKHEPALEAPAEPPPPPPTQEEPKKETIKPRTSTGIAGAT